MNVLNRKWYPVKYREEAGEDGDQGGGGLPPTAPSFDDVLGGVDESIRTEAGDMLKDIHSMNDLVKGYVHGQRALGSSIRIPGEDSGDEAKQKFYEKLSGVPGIAITKDEESLRKSLGVPSDPKEYKVDLSTLPENVEVSQSELDEKRALWHKLGYSPKQAEMAAQMWAEEINSDAEGWKAQNIEAERKLKEELGATYDEAMENVRFMTNSVLDKDTVEYLRVTGALAHPGVVKMLADNGKAYRDDGTIEAARHRSVGYTPSEAKDMIAEIRGNPAYMNSHDPQHKSLVDKMQQLYKFAYPG